MKYDIRENLYPQHCIFSIAFKLSTHAAATMRPQQHWWPGSEQAILNQTNIKFQAGITATWHR